MSIKMKKNRVALLWIAGLCCAPLLSYADNLVIVNNTDKFSTSIINSGMCSSGLAGGVTKPYSTNIVDERIAKLACGIFKTNCRADVFLTNNCSGPILTTVVFDVSLGVKSVTPAAIPGYEITFSGFMFSLNAV